MPPSLFVYSPTKFSLPNKPCGRLAPRLRSGIKYGSWLAPAWGILQVEAKSHPDGLGNISGEAQSSLAIPTHRFRGADILFVPGTIFGTFRVPKIEVVEVSNYKRARTTHQWQKIHGGAFSRSLARQSRGNPAG